MFTVFSYYCMFFLISNLLVEMEIEYSLCRLSIVVVELIYFPITRRN